jgi:hypothetical protein
MLTGKEHYTFDLLGLAEEHSERQLELALVKNTATSCSPHPFSPPFDAYDLRRP